MKIKVNENYRLLEKNYLFSEVARRVARFREAHPEAKIIHLGIGDVTLPLPKAVTRAMAAAVEEMGSQETFRGYAPEAGYDFLLEAIQRHYQRFGVELALGEIFSCDGAKSDVANLTELFGQNLVCIPDPVYPVYVDSNRMLGREIAFVPATEENEYLPGPAELEDAVGATPEGVIIYLCSPNNPTGAVYDRAQLEEWVKFARATGSLIIFDSAYESFIAGDFPHSIFEVEGAKECAIEVASLSKSAGFTGTRCSWTVVPAGLEAGGMNLNEMWSRRQTTKFNGVPYVVQRGAEAALSPEGEAECEALVAYYRENAELMGSVFDECGIAYTGGAQSPYLWVSCPGGLGSWEFFDRLLEDVHVVGTPGAGFGKYGEGHLRLTSFGSHESTAEACERLRHYLS